MDILLYSQMGRGKGGGESVFEKISNGLEMRGHKVTRLYYDSDQCVGCYKFYNGGYNLFLYMPPKLKMFLHPKFLYRFIASFVGLFFFLYRNRPKVVNYHYFMASSFYFVLFKKIFGYRLILSCHGSDVHTIEGVKRYLAPFILNQVDLVTGVSKSLIKKLKRKIPGNYKTQVIYNGVDIEFWSNNKSCPRRQDSEEGLFIVSVGSLKPVKGHDVLLNAFQEVIRTYSKYISLNIIGEGPNKYLYKQFISKKNLSNYIHLKGWLTPEEVREELNKASIFVFPSRKEGFGLALVEAMAAGLPIIASDTGGIPEILKDTEALLVPTESPNDLADAIIKALTNLKWRSKAMISSQRCAQRFGWEETINQYEQVLVFN